MNSPTYIRLSLMMFLEYLVWGAWYVTMGTYLGTTLQFDGLQISSAYGTGAIAAMVSPFFVGLIADRFFATERVLGVMHLVGAVLMYFVASADNFGTFYPLLLGYTLCYMPTIALTNSVAFHQMDDAGKQFPTVRVWGTIGWIVIGLIIGYMGIEAQALPLEIAAGLSVILGLYSFTLPHTPPKGKGEKISFADIVGLDALSLLANRSFLIFFLASVLICIPLMFYYSFTNLFLNELGVENAAGKMTMGQMSEILFLLVMPLLFRRLGVKKMMLIGMGAWALRYVLFAFGDPQGMIWMLYAGIILHGICYDFFFVTGQIYADERAPDNLRSSVQGMMTFATYGVGMFIGSLVSGPIVDMYATAEGSAIPHSWKEIWIIPAVFAVLVMFVFWLMFKEEQKVTESESTEVA